MNMSTKLEEAKAEFESFRKNNSNKSRMYYPKDLKRMATELCLEAKLPRYRIADELGVGRGSLHNWCQDFGENNLTSQSPQRLEIVEESSAGNIAIFVIPRTAVNSGILDQIKAML